MDVSINKPMKDGMRTRFQTWYASKVQKQLKDFPVEVSAAVSKLECGKAAGPDGFMAEHLKAGGEAVIMLLLNALNTNVELGIAPDILKRVVVAPVYKGSGKDPPQVDSCQGVISSMVAKVWSFSVLRGLKLICCM